MSYCRFAWDGSDVYVYEGENGFNCCGCWLNERGFDCDTPEQMILHLAAHRRAGHFVPFHAVESMWNDIEGAREPVRPEPSALTAAKQAMSCSDPPAVSRPQDGEQP